MYGRIMLDQGSGYQVYTEKVFLCSSEGEYTPSYDPAKKQFGCLEDSHYLVHRMKVLVSMHAFIDLYLHLNIYIFMWCKANCQMFCTAIIIVTEVVFPRLYGYVIAIL